jgi:hypothetical protein
MMASKVPPGIGDVHLQKPNFHPFDLVINKGINSNFILILITYVVSENKEKKNLHGDY